MSEIKDEFAYYDDFPIGIFIYQLEKLKLVYMNKTFISMLECETKEEVLDFMDGDISNIICVEDVDEIKTITKIALQNSIGMNHNLYYRIQTAKGNRRSIQDIGNIIETERYGKVVLNTYVDSELKSVSEIEAKDRLTHLFSMHRFYNFSEQVIRNENDFEAGKFNFVFFNIRNFKNFNLQKGMEYGDEVLIDLAGMIRNNSDTNIISRFNGDHFAMFSKAMDVYDITKQIISEFNLKYSNCGIKLKAGIFPVNYMEIKVASACDLAKSACDSIRNSNTDIRIYDEMLHKKINQGSYFVNSLDTAIQKDYIKVYYQPIIRTVTGSLCCMEALARWEDPNHGMYMPGDFISVFRG